VQFRGYAALRRASVRATVDGVPRIYVQVKGAPKPFRAGPALARGVDLRPGASAGSTVDRARRPPLNVDSSSTPTASATVGFSKVAGIRVRLRSTEVLRVPAKQTVPFERRNGRNEFQAPPLTIHDAYQIRFQEGKRL